MTGLLEVDQQKILRDLGDCLAWLRAMGIKAPGARFETYRRHVQEWVEACSGSKAWAQFVKQSDADAFANSIFEAIEWHLIYQAVSVLEMNEEIRARLREAVRGPVNYRNEKQTNARDYQFELAFGARLLKAGYSAQFGDGGDLSFPLRDRRIFVECKRPQSPRSVERLVRHALSQLECRYRNAESPRDCRGFIAISFTKVANPDQYMGFRADNWPDFDRQMRPIGDAIMREHSRHWRSPVDPRTIGAAAEFRCIGMIESDPQQPYLTATTQTVWQGLRPPYDLDRVAWKEISNCIQEAHRGSNE